MLLCPTSPASRLIKFFELAGFQTDRHPSSDTKSDFKLCDLSLHLFFKHWTVSLVGRKAESTDGKPLKRLQHLKVEVFFHFHMQSLSKNTLVHNSLHLCSFTSTPAHFLLHIKPQELRIFMHFQCPD